MGERKELAERGKTLFAGYRHNVFEICEEKRRVTRDRRECKEIAL